jgi:hypothetical protein
MNSTNLDDYPSHEEWWCFKKKKREARAKREKKNELSYAILIVKIIPNLKQVQLNLLDFVAFYVAYIKEPIYHN